MNLRALRATKRREFLKYGRERVGVHYLQQQKQEGSEQEARRTEVQPNRKDAHRLRAKAISSVSTQKTPAAAGVFCV